ncbi:MAG TPA: L,D-transpeptidase family protein [Chitinophagaceae bacterium]|nr:L,D-transpeptidase family protein [Chitinophagaceae bacterium]
MSKMHRLILLCLLISFNYCTGPSNNRSKSGKPVRNLAINKTNSYSTLFLDSTTVESFIKEQKLNDSISDDMRVFYNARNFQFAWFSGDGLTEQTFIFRSLYDYSNEDKKRKPLDLKLDNLMLNDSLKSLRATRNITKTELLFTWRFIQYLWNSYPNKNLRNNLLVNFIPAQKQQTTQRAEAILQDDLKGTNAAYNALKKEFEKFVKIARGGGWPTIPLRKKKYKIGSTDTVITIIKKRLHITGQFIEKDSSPVFTTELQNAVKRTQNSYGFTADGMINASLLEELNKPVSFRLQQLMINMERMRWQPEDHRGRMIVVNIPEFMLHVWKGKSKEFDMEVIVGKEGNSTIMFSGKLEQIVFNPYWNVPESIVRNEILPSMEENPDYLHDHDMEITGEYDSLPVIRQLPGDKNDLGKVKFLFPNSFDIYFHDTPQKDLFKKQQRAYSHGCIRLADAEKLATYLLKDNAEWSSEKIQEAMNSGKEKTVNLKDPVPVLINYYTAWVDENRALHFRKDIYGHDKKTRSKLFSNN